MFHFSISTDPCYGFIRRKTPMDNSREELVVQQRERHVTHRRIYLQLVSEIYRGQRVLKLVDYPLLASRSSTETEYKTRLRTSNTRLQSYRQRVKSAFNPCSPNRFGNCPNGTDVIHNSPIAAPIFAPRLFLQVALPCKRNSRVLDRWRFPASVWRRDGQRSVSDQRGRS